MNPGEYIAIGILIGAALAGTLVGGMWLLSFYLNRWRGHKLDSWAIEIIKRSDALARMVATKLNRIEEAVNKESNLQGQIEKGYKDNNDNETMAS